MAFPAQYKVLLMFTSTYVTYNGLRCKVKVRIIFLAYLNGLFNKHSIFWSGVMNYKFIFHNCRPAIKHTAVKRDKGSGARLNTKMSSYQYRNSRYKDNTISRPSYLYNGNLHTWKDSLYIETGPRWSLCIRWAAVITTTMLNDDNVCTGKAEKK